MVTLLVDVLTQFAVNLLIVIGVCVLGLCAAAISCDRESQWYEDRAVESDRSEL